jgi:hypothetical protein
MRGGLLVQEITVAAIRSGDRYHSPGVADQRRFPGRGEAAKINRSRRRELKQASGGELFRVSYFAQISRG